MTRNFSLTFLFEQQPYEAAVTVYEDPEPSSISATVNHTRLHQLVPESKEALQINIDEGAAKGNAPIDQLKQAILQAFKEHEKQSPPINLW